MKNEEDEELCLVCGGEPRYLGYCEHGEKEGDPGVGLEYFYVCTHPDVDWGDDCPDVIGNGLCPIGHILCPECECRLDEDKQPIRREMI